MPLIFKQLISGFFIGLIFLGSFNEAAVYVVFKMNQSYIAKNLCMERDNPESTCKGCCQLKKKIDQTRQQEQNMPVSQKQQKEISAISFYLSNLTLSSFLDQMKPHNSICTFYNNHYAFLSIHDFFHPPKAFL